jgi:hypothetical protein
MLMLDVKKSRQKEDTCFSATDMEEITKNTTVSKNDKLITD